MTQESIPTFTCLEVLDRLSDVIDGRLAETELAGVRAHLDGCDACSRFGGSTMALVAAVREKLAEPPPLPPAFLARVLAVAKG